MPHIHHQIDSFIAYIHASIRWMKNWFIWVVKRRQEQNIFLIQLISHSLFMSEDWHYFLFNYFCVSTCNRICFSWWIMLTYTQYQQLWWVTKHLASKICLTTVKHAVCCRLHTTKPLHITYIQYKLTLIVSAIIYYYSFQYMFCLSWFWSSLSFSFSLILAHSCHKIIIISAQAMVWFINTICFFFVVAAEIPSNQCESLPKKKRTHTHTFLTCSSLGANVLVPRSREHFDWLHRSVSVYNKYMQSINSWMVNMQ